MPGYSRKDVVAKAQAEAKEFSNTIRGTWSPGQLFAISFFVMCFLVYLFPLMSVWDLAHDTHVSYWFGTYAFWWTLPIPLLFIGVFLYHLRRHHPKRKAVMISIIVPCVTFFLIGASFKVKSDGLMDKIIFDDCGAHDPYIRELETAAIDAEKFFKECNPMAFRAVTLENCPDFKEWRKSREKEWNYLQYLEIECGCSSFCHSGINVWTPPEAMSHQDACSNCVLSVMRTKVQYVSFQLMGYAIIVTVAFLGYLAAIKSTLHEIAQGAHDQTPRTSRGDHYFWPNHHDREAVFVPALTPPPVAQNVSLAPRPVAAPVRVPTPAPVHVATTAAPMAEAAPVVVSTTTAPVLATPFYGTDPREQVSLASPSSQYRSLQSLSSQY